MQVPRATPLNDSKQLMTCFDRRLLHRAGILRAIRFTYPTIDRNAMATR
jgi:hypothetical protein